MADRLRPAEFRRHVLKDPQNAGPNIRTPRKAGDRLSGPGRPVHPEPQRAVLTEPRSVTLPPGGGTHQQSPHPCCRPRCLRHAYATLMLEDGEELQ